MVAQRRPRGTPSLQDFAVGRQTADEKPVVQAEGAPEPAAPDDHAPTDAGPPAMSVAELVRGIDRLVGQRENFGDVWVLGELSGFRPHGSGHWYFSLKDDDAKVDCVMFRGDTMSVPFEPEEGMEVLLHARANVFPRWGKLQLVADVMRPGQMGALAKAFEQLKKKLGDQGLFDPARKRPLPGHPTTVGIVTSLSGAALRDMVNVARRRNPALRILIVDARVQGEGAAATIVRGIQRLVDDGTSDVIIIGRGGGSIEELWAFNEEAVVRAVADCPVPIVSAVGHETDTTLSDLAADVRAPTPSAAAEIVVPDAVELLRTIDAHEHRLRDRLERLVPELAQRVDELADRLGHGLRNRAVLARQRLDGGKHRLTRAVPDIRRLREHIIERNERLAAALRRTWDDTDRRLRAAAAHLDAVSPLKVLGRGYAIAQKDGHALRSIQGLAPGDDVGLVLSDGAAHATINTVKPDPDKAKSRAPGAGDRS